MGMGMVRELSAFSPFFDIINLLKILNFTVDENIEDYCYYSVTSTEDYNLVFSTHNIISCQYLIITYCEIIMIRYL